MMAKHNRMNRIRVPKVGKSKINEIKLSLFKKCSEISVLYDIQIFVAITDDKNNLSVLSTKTEVSEYISNNLKIPLNATEIFTSKSVIIYINKYSSPIMIQSLLIHQMMKVLDSITIKELLLKKITAVL